MGRKVFVTGLGLVSSIGLDVSSCLEHLFEGQAGVAEIEHLKTNHKGKLPLCEVKLTNNELQNRLGNLLGTQHPVLNQKLNRTALLAILAAHEAWTSANSPDIQNQKTALFSGNTVGGMDLTEHFYADFLQNYEQGGDVSVLMSHECGSSTEKIADALGLCGMISTINTACSSSANSIMLGARLIKAGIIDRAIVGGTDALTKFTVNGFNVLQILDDRPCQPFDENRRGLNLGEGAGYLMLEAEGIAPQSMIKAEIIGYANSNDAYHQTASSPDGKGAYLAMKEAMAIANLKPEDIDYINVHGTGTNNNDLSEGIAIKSLFENSMPPFSSTKSYTGHTLGASGGIEAVFSVLSLQHQTIFPNLRFETPIESLDNMIPVTELKKNYPMKHILSNSFGFGGNTSALIFSKNPA